MIKVKIGDKVRNIVKIDYYIEKDGRLHKMTFTIIREGNQIIWQGVRSCYGSGKWIEEKPWLDSDVWKD